MTDNRYKLSLFSQLYGDDFELYSRTEAPSNICKVIYNEPKQELIVCGVGYLQVSIHQQTLGVSCTEISSADNIVCRVMFSALEIGT